MLCALLLWCGCDKSVPEVPDTPVTPVNPPAPEKEEANITWIERNMEIFPAEGGETELSFKTNNTWSASVDATANGWCKLTPNKGEAGNVTFKVKVNENTTYKERKATIVVKAGDVSETLYVTQQAKEKAEGYLTLSADTCIVGIEGGIVKVHVDTNVDYEVSIPSVEWLQESINPSIAEHSFIVATNDTNEKRSVEIIFSDETEGVADTLCIVQKGPAENGSIDDMPEHPL